MSNHATNYGTVALHNKRLQNTILQFVVYKHWTGSAGCRGCPHPLGTQTWAVEHFEYRTK